MQLHGDIGQKKPPKKASGKSSWCPLAPPWRRAQHTSLHISVFKVGMLVGPICPRLSVSWDTVLFGFDLRQTASCTTVHGYPHRTKMRVFLLPYMAYKRGELQRKIQEKPRVSMGFTGQAVGGVYSNMAHGAYCCSATTPRRSTGVRIEQR